jgi:hypothetical protein
MQRNSRNASQRAYNSTLLKDLTRNIQWKVVWVNNTLHKAQVSWELLNHNSQLSDWDVEKIEEPCWVTAYQFAIKVIWYEHPLDIQPDILGLPISYVLFLWSRHIKNWPEFYFTLHKFRWITVTWMWVVNMSLFITMMAQSEWVRCSHSWDVRFRQHFKPQIQTNLYK